MGGFFSSITEVITLAEMHFMHLNLMQIFDVLRAAPFARLAVNDDQPFVTPVYFQLEVAGSEVIFHLSASAQGRKARALQHHPTACLEFELPGCAWLDTVLASGPVTLAPAPAGEGLLLRLHALELTGRRYFLPSD